MIVKDTLSILSAWKNGQVAKKRYYMLVIVHTLITALVRSP